MATSLQRFSTTSLPLPLRVDAWREHFRASWIDVAHAYARNFHGQLASAVALDGIAIQQVRADPVACHFGQRDSHMVLLGLVEAGQVGIRAGACSESAAVPHDRLLLFDCDRPLVVEAATRYALTYLALPRELVTGALGREPVDGPESIRVLDATGLAARLAMELSSFARAGHTMSAEALSHLAVATLVRSGHNWRNLPDNLDAVVVQAAEVVLQDHLEDRAFTVAKLAAMLGCSRAHLYRLFTRQGKTIAGSLQRRRLWHARQLLLDDLGCPVGTVAWRCGYADPSAFGKAFRRHYGYTPTQLRHELCAKVTVRRRMMTADIARDV